MNIKTIGIFAALVVFVATPALRAEDESYEEVEVEYQDYEVFDDVEDLIDEELVESVEAEAEQVENIEEPEVVDVPAPRAVADRLSCDEINTRVAELQADVKSYPELKADLEYMLSRQRNQCAPRAARRPVHNYRNVNPVTEIEIPEVSMSTEPPAVEKTPEEIAAEEAVAEAARQAQIEENRGNGLCDDGAKPNQYGCCDGEVFKQVEHLNFACCPKEGDGDCVASRKK
jgi:hypothetical protein